jgi:hypothetical protein
MPNIHDQNVIQKITEVEGDKWEKSQVSSARNGEVSVIYGSSGVARYFVDEDGEISYSVLHGAEPDKASEKGFNLW